MEENIKRRPMKHEIEDDPKKINWDALDFPIQHEGKSITIPAIPDKMPIPEAIKALARKHADDEQMFNIRESIDAYPLDAAVAFVKAMANLYGWASPVPKPGFFGPQMPEMCAIKVGPCDDDIVQCPMGSFKIPGVDREINTTIGDLDEVGEDKFWIFTTVKKRDRDLVIRLANETRRIVRESSIYKGKPISLKVDGNGELVLRKPPEFLDVSNVSESDALFDEDIEVQIWVNILTLITKTQECQRLGIPMKRGILLTGKFGTGKTLLARSVASVAQKHNWTFILLERVQGLRAALTFAVRYQPAIVMAEDIDRITGERDDEMNDLINTIDGVISKSSQVMTILTTNHVEKIDPHVLRQGRLDAMIALRPPSALTVERLLRHYARGLISEETSLTNAGRELAGQIPAAIRECVERSKLAMVWRGGDHLLDADLVVAAQTMKNHLDLLNKGQVVETPAEKLADSLKEVISNGGNSQYEHIDKSLTSMTRILSNVQRMVKDF